MLARCIAKDDAGKYFAVIDMMFKKLDEWSLPADPLQGFVRVFATLGMSEESVETCLKDQGLFDQLPVTSNAYLIAQEKKHVGNAENWRGVNERHSARQVSRT